MGGGFIGLPGGARLDVPIGVVEGETLVSLIRSEVPNIPAKGELLSDAYYLASQGRPQVKGDFTLSIPYDISRLASDVSEGSLRAYALLDGRLLYPVPSYVDASWQVVVVPNPEVSVLENPIGISGARKQSGSPDYVLPSGEPPAAKSLAPGTGYILGKGAPANAEAAKCLTGAPGEVHEEPGHAFRIIFEVQAPCSFAKYVSGTLQDAYNKYNAVYTDTKGNPPFAHFSADNRMPVYLGSYPKFEVQYIYLSWNGYIQIDARAGQGNQQQLRETLFHEMFHAFQDLYSNMYLGNPEAHWWYCATAEWARLTDKGFTFSEMVKDKISKYPYILSVPIQKSGDYANGKLVYGYALLIDYIERQNPGYVRDVLNTWKTLSSQLYDHLIAEGKLAQTYPDFVKKVLGNALPSSDPWTQASIFESDTETQIFTHPTTTIGDKSVNVQRLTEDRQRFTDLRFSAQIPPLTTRFFLVKAGNLKKARTIEVRLTQDGSPTDTAWLFTTLLTSAEGPLVPPRRLSTTGSIVRGVGKDYDELWIAAFNSDPTKERRYDLTVKMNKEQTATVTAKGSTTTYPPQTLYGDVTLTFELTPRGKVTGSSQRVEERTLGIYMGKWVCKEEWRSNFTWRGNGGSVFPGPAIPFYQVTYTVQSTRVVTVNPEIKLLPGDLKQLYSCEPGTETLSSTGPLAAPFITASIDLEKRVVKLTQGTWQWELRIQLP